MKIEIKNYRGIATANLELANIALVCGPNGAGKSSIAEAVAAACTRNPSPIQGLRKKDASMLLKDGEKRGQCVVSDETGSVTINWPGGTVTATEVAPQCTAMAAGLESLLDMTPVNRAEHLIHYMKALPTEADLQDALAPADVSAVWSVIQSDGWDKAHDRAKERGAKMKGAWEQITGDNYGGTRAASWEHPALERYAGVTLGELQTASSEARAALEAAQANRGTAQQVLDGLKEKVRIAKEAEPFIKQMKVEIADTAIAAVNAKEALDALPHPETAEAMAECPHCKGHLVVVTRTSVRKPAEGGVDEATNAARSEAIAVAQAKLDELSQYGRELDQGVAVYVSQQAAGTKAAADLARQPSGTATSEDVVRAQQAVQAADSDLAQFTAAHDAQERATAMQANIQANLLIIEQLAPQGLRQRVLDRKMVEFNAMLTRMCKTAGWPAVVVDDDLSVTFGGRPTMLCSKGEQYRVRAILQLAVADLDGSELAILDGADILDRFGRNGLFKMLASAKIKALVCMTIDGRDKVPNIKSAGLGQAYWIDQAELQEVV